MLVNMTNNPQFIKEARDALQNSAMNLNPRIEGTTIVVDIPKVTREHREKLSKAAKVRLYCVV